MLPLQQAYEVKEAVLEYVRATYRLKDADADRAFRTFVTGDETGLFKGPYISLKTPFVKADPDERLPLEICPPFVPHLHQTEAFRRLTTHGGHRPQPTLLTTGTGSGKTECFLFPVLDYVYRMNRNGRQRGVKVIIMYPMNALASDQAKRLAETVWGDERLRGNVTAGLFIGEDRKGKEYPRSMGEHHIIEERNAILEQTPDILLTNFKMLDYALMRQRYMPLWRGNIDTPQPMLRFIVLDELHTYDGAQGTDVANLLRRLRLKLGIAPGRLTPVGTSATIGSGEDSRSLLCRYASDVFGEEFAADSVIGEKRMAAADFFYEYLDDYFPQPAQLKKLVAVKGADDYVRTARRVWLGSAQCDPVETGRRLRGMRIVRDLVSAAGGGIMTVKTLTAALGRTNKRMMATVRSAADLAPCVVESLLALISEAKEEGGRFPLLYVQVQLWMRELSGIERVVAAEPEFTWRNSIPVDGRISLPVYYCRDCGASGWVTTKGDGASKLGTDSARINGEFMRRGRDVRLMTTDTRQHEPEREYLGEQSRDEQLYVRTEDLTVGSPTDEGVMKIRLLTRWRQRGSKIEMEYRCPLCMGDAVAVMGGRTSTLSSVAVSQIMSSDFDTRDAAGRKMLTFTNSVQDAAHLAGFYEVRTFRFLFRQSIQQYLKAAGRAMTLRELQEGFKAYWKQRLDGDEYYYRFIPDELVEKIDLAHSYRDSGGGFLRRFREEFDLRVDWEICSEFGLRSQLGRTLEKMGASATSFREGDLRKVLEKMRPWMEYNHLGYAAGDERLFLSFLNGVLHRMRMRGAVDHEYLRLYRTEQMRPVMLNWPRKLREQHFLCKTFSGTRLPRMVGVQSCEQLDVVTTRRGNWFSRFFEKSLHAPMTQRGFLTAVMNLDVVNDFYRTLLETMTETGLLDRRVTKSGLVNYALRPEAVTVEAAVKQIKCDTCESRMMVAAGDSLTEGMHCIDRKCTEGEYRTVETIADNYYRRVYNRDLSPRIYAAEHTGLLERGVRERLETDFKTRPTPQSCNVLTATSTLEMGIDIGDLNVVANTGIPPLPANFLQRVGRAGRKEGAALVLNYAKSAKHDMYYFAEPLAMMEGDVSTPGCFLEAKDILRRHFLAFCIDSWTSADSGNTIPPIIELTGSLRPGMTAEPGFFLCRIGQFVSQRHGQLMERFRGQYPEAVQTVLDSLAEAVAGGGLINRALDEFDSLTAQLEHIKEERRELKKRLDAIPENDEERRRDVYGQHRALRAKMTAMMEQSTIEFMTNAGLLPNYAFPETGVKLSATILYRKEPGDDFTHVKDPDALELVRPASQGIKELAPGNDFYTQKLHLEVKGLSLADRTDSLKVMKHCSECDALEAEGDDDYSLTRCPKCGSESWAANYHRFLRFTSATTSVYRSEAALDDRNDERESKAYHRMRHFRFRQEGPVVSFGLKSVGFGIELCRDMTLTEVNYGSQLQSGPTREVNRDARIPEAGFVTCRHCGKSVAVTGGQDVQFHYPYCNHKEVGYPADEEHSDTFEELYLYREMQTEGIKVLLPVQLFDTGATVAMFKAGLELGMRHYYKSNPAHIRIDEYSEMNRATGQMDNYLVIYDTIPGGTGYLAKLYDTREFTELIRISYEHIRDCSCQLEGKDGCYRCIMSYGNQWQRGLLSRERAEELFGRIYRECGSWETVSGSIGTITTSGVIEDSELETLFVKAMERIARDNRWTWTRRTDAVEGSYTYELLIRDDRRELKWAVHPQYRFSAAAGVAKQTRPDFQFVCAYAKVDGEELAAETVPAWSVYIDGYAFHANKDNMRFYNDLEKREAIRLSPSPLLSWTLTWDDIRPYVTAGEEPAAHADSLYAPQLMTDFPCELWKRKDSMGRLVFMLLHPDLERIRQEVYAFLATCWTDREQLVTTYSGVEAALKDGVFLTLDELPEEDACEDHFFIKTSFIPRNGLLSGVALYPYDREADYGGSVRYDWHLTPGLEEIDKEEWADFWRRYNLLQVFGNRAAQETADEAAPEAVDLDEILLYFPDLEDVVARLVADGIPFNTEGGYELTDDDGVTVAEAAIKLDGKDVVIDDFAASPEAAEAFRTHGFTVIDKTDFLSATTLYE